jgi:hypothetical protein
LGKRRDVIASGVSQEGERKRTTEDGSKGFSDDVETEAAQPLREKSGG